MIAQVPLRPMLREAAEVVGIKRIAFESGVSSKSIQRWKDGKATPLPVLRERVVESLTRLVERYPGQPWEACRHLAPPRR